MRAIALAHQGTVTLSDGEPTGAVFTLVLPIDHSPDPDTHDDTDTALDSQVEDQTEELPIWHGS